jgi:hypothetical protein
MEYPSQPEKYIGGVINVSSYSTSGARQLLFQREIQK